MRLVTAGEDLWGSLSCCWASPSLLPSAWARIDVAVANNDPTSAAASKARDVGKLAEEGADPGDCEAAGLTTVVVSAIMARGGEVLSINFAIGPFGCGFSARRFSVLEIQRPECQ